MTDVLREKIYKLFFFLPILIKLFMQQQKDRKEIEKKGILTGNDRKKLVYLRRSSSSQNKIF